MNKLDCRGLACPMPVIETKKALSTASGETLTVLVDNRTAKENVVKFAVSQQCGVSIEEQAGVINILITKPKAPTIAAKPAAGQVWLITQDTLGHGNKELGTVLMKSFMFTLTEQEPPEKLLFLNSGVLLTVQESPVLDYIRALAAKGTEVLSCGTCLDYFQAKDRLAIGGISNMYTIVEAIADGRAVIL